MTQKDESYLHGFSRAEQERLIKQAEFLEFSVFQNVNFFNNQHVLEVGCGVGAQSQILLRRFPRLKLTGIDLSAAQLQVLAERTAGGEVPADRFTFKQANAENLPFAPGTFDGAFFCWILEHVPNPEKILGEVKRVLAPGSNIVISEVMNSSFFLDPYSPNVWKYWMGYNDYQYEKAGDPFVGAKLGNLLLGAGYTDIQTQVKALHFDNRQPEQRRGAIAYWSELLLSGAPQLLQENYVTAEVVSGMLEELNRVAQDPKAVFFYSYMQAQAVVPA